MAVKNAILNKTDDLEVLSGDITINSGNTHFPSTNAALTEGVITVNSTPYIHSFGTGNVFMGAGAGNGTSSGSGENVGIGLASLEDLSTGEGNTHVGYASGINVSSGNYNTSIGWKSLQNMITGSYNTCIGYNAGINHTNAESSNISIGSPGTSLTDNRITIGVQGSGAGQQDETYIAGIYDTAPGSGTYQNIVVDANGQIGKGDVKLASEVSGVLPVTNGGYETTGFASWDGAGPFYDDTVLGDFTLLKAGLGYIQGVPVSWVGSQTVSGLTAGNTYYIYIDNTGTIGKTTSYSESLFEDNIVLFECMRDSTPGTNVQISVKENHPYTYPIAVSIWAHDTLGPVISGMQGGANITINGTQKIEISGADELEDHGLETQIPDSGGVAEVFEQYYTLGSGKWARYAQSDTFNGQWNNAGTPTAISGNKYTVNRLYVSKDDLNSSTPTYFSVMGDAEYNNLSAADTAIANDTIPTATGELAMLELAQLGYIVYEQSSSSIVQVIIAKETARTSFSGVTATTASLVLTDTTNFDQILSAADTTVQSALETIDDWGKLPSLPATNAALTEGVIRIGGTRYFHAYGTDNVFVGKNSGNGTLSGANYNVAVGSNTLDALTSGDYNMAFGYNALTTVTTGVSNVAVGGFALEDVLGGNFNVGIGTEAGKNITSGGSNLIIGRLGASSLTTGSGNLVFGTSMANVTTGSGNIVFAGGSGLTTSDSNNIVFSNSGTAGDNNTIRLGTQGTGASQQDTTFIAGIYNTTPAGTTINNVIIDSNGQLGAIPTVVEVTGTSQAMAINNTYIANNAALVTLTLPDTAAIGSTLKIVGKGAGKFKIAQNAGETIYFGSSSTTTGVGGSLTADIQYGALELMCIAAGVDWVVNSSSGNFTIV